LRLGVLGEGARGGQNPSQRGDGHDELAHRVSFFVVASGGNALPTWEGSDKNEPVRTWAAVGESPRAPRRTPPVHHRGAPARAAAEAGEEGEH
jgi:hypothetical protein